MDYISAEEFLKQSEKVQKSLLDWWQPQIGNLYCDIDAHGITNVSCVLRDKMIDVIKMDKKYNYYIPLFTETQLRKFIEEKINCYIELIVGVKGYVIVLRSKDKIKEVKRISILHHDLLQIYWQIAIKIAEEI